MTAVRVYCFYEPFSGLGDATPLIDLWRESWERQGWKTEVLSEKDAATHPNFAEYCRRVDSYPTVNDREYESACYHRWMAMAQMEDSLAVMTDYDVINRSFTPDDADRLLGDGNLLILEPTRVPCAVLGTPDGFQMLCAEIARCQPSAKDTHNGKPHVSDMVITRKSRIPYTDVAVEFGCSGKPIPNDLGDGWKRAKLIHYATYGFIRKGIHGGSKVDKIKTQMRLLNNERPLAVR